MSAPATLFESSLTSLPLLARGKVRDMYEVDNDHLLIVTTDRLSAFDVILDTPIPGKGKVLTEVSNFWFDFLDDIIPNHLSDLSLEQVLPNANERAQVEGRAIVAKRLKPLPVEAIVRGYLIGSGWKDYLRTGEICGISLLAGLQQAQQLPAVIYTPSSKAAVGDHDENISFEQTVELIGKSLAEQVREVSITLYSKAAEHARRHGIIIADTKFEFGVDNTGALHLIDEALTPDSSRFWDASEYQIGTSPASFDKQIVRDYLETLDWDKTPPAPTIDPQVAQRTADRYREVQRKLTEHG